jgi:hypothetical protein
MRNRPAPTSSATAKKPEASTIQSLLDDDPPVASGGNVYPTNPAFFDTIGRRYRVGVRFRF